MRTIRVLLDENGDCKFGGPPVELEVLGEFQGMLVCRPENESYGWPIAQSDIDRYNIDPKHLDTQGWYVSADEDVPA